MDPHLIADHLDLLLLTMMDQVVAKENQVDRRVVGKADLDPVVLKRG